jgi:hypothetical protein
LITTAVLAGIAVAVLVLFANPKSPSPTVRTELDRVSGAVRELREREGTQMHRGVA